MLGGSSGAEKEHPFGLLRVLLNGSTESQSEQPTLINSMKTTHLVSPVVTLLALAGTLLSQNIEIPNGSFESPNPPPGFPATPQVDNWQKASQPDGIPLPGGITWEQLSGVFPNTPAGATDHIGNMTGNQAAYLFAIPGVALYQSLNSTFEIGKSYDLTFDLLGGGGIAEGSSFLMSLFYMDGNTQVTLAATPITYSAAGFPDPTHLYTFGASVSEVQAGDAWAGKTIGLQLASTFGTGVGYWDVDNVQLVAVPEPTTFGVLALAAGGLLVAGVPACRRK